MGFGGRGGFKGKSQGGGRGGKKSSFVRVGNMFESDKEYTPENAEFQYSTKLDKQYLDAVRDVLNNNDAVRFTLTKWSDGDCPVLSVAPITNGSSRGRTTTRRDDSRGSGPQRGNQSRFAGSRGRSIEEDRPEPEQESEGEAEQDNNWEK